MIAGNKGEWSEVYALLKIIADKNLYQGDGDLKKLSGPVLPIIKIIRAELDGTYEYQIQDKIVIIIGSGNVFEIPIIDFQTQAKILYKKIKSGSNASFEIAEIEAFISTFNCKSLKANSSLKSDIRIILHDAITGASPELGFSIKSQLGRASTLLNAGKTTNFIYKIEGDKLSAEEINEINAIDSSCKVRDRLIKIEKLNKKLVFVKTEKLIFSNNLTLIDSALPQILAEIIYSYYSSDNTKIADLVEAVSKKNPLNFDLSEEHPFYVYKIKRLITDIALGMMPSKVWSGKLEATGGYLVVKEDGEVLSYHIYNRNDFEDYLFKNIKLETASTNKHDFGLVYEENDEQFFKLNLQIRFLK